MTPAEKIRKLIEEAEAAQQAVGANIHLNRLGALRECLAIVEEAERARDDA